MQGSLMNRLLEDFCCSFFIGITSDFCQESFRYLATSRPLLQKPNERQSHESWLYITIMTVFRDEIFCLAVLSILR